MIFGDLMNIYPSENFLNFALIIPMWFLSRMNFRYRGKGGERIENGFGGIVVTGGGRFL